MKAVRGKVKTKMMGTISANVLKMGGGKCCPLRLVNGMEG